MTSFEIYTLVLCIIVYVLLTTLSIVVITIIAKQSLKIIRLGGDDKQIIDEDKKKKNKKLSKTFDFIVTGLLALIFIFFFCSSMYINCVQNTYFENAPTYKVVKTGSMASKNEKNKYLFDNDLNNQIQSFDLIATYKLPAEKDLKLYDIVVYELDGILLVHRIVGIEEPNGEHPNSRYFLLQGDAVEKPDRFPVMYSQMRGIYRGERIPAVGSFVLFMQSPAGWLCIILVAVAIVATPILEKKLAKAREARLVILLGGAAKADESASTEDLTSKHKLFEHLRQRKAHKKGFDQRLRRATKDVKQRYSTVVNHIKNIDNVREIESDHFRTFRVKNKPVAKVTMRGKTINVYLALNPKDYANTKYVFQDVSTVKKYARYPMRVRLSSERQVKYTLELIDKISQSHSVKEEV